MRHIRFTLLLLLLAWPGLSAQAAAKAKLIKILPLYLDQAGRSALSPSLYDRDAYQAQLRRRPADRSGQRFTVQWRAGDVTTLKLRIELRGFHDKETTTALLEQIVKHGGGLSQWTELTLGGEDYKKFGDLIAWRATLWDGEKLVGEQKSFLW